MSLNVGTLSAFLTLDSTGFDRGAAQAGAGANALSSKITGAFKAASIAVTAVSAAAVGVGAKLIQVGVGYNALEQASRAALGVIMHSTSAAADQMDRLFAFTKTSPLPKDAFIAANQQLISFGISGDQTLKTLSAINDAVTATAGGSEQVQQLARAFGQVQSAGKVTGDTLMSLSAMGIDGAKILAEAYGTTAAKMKDDVSAGNIDAARGIQVLTDGIKAQFGGAGEAVKNTWNGTVDRIKAAYRDIGSMLVAPFIDPMGGGYAVKWGNQVADIMRSLQALGGRVFAQMFDSGAPGQMDQITAALTRINNGIKNISTDQIIRVKVEAQNLLEKARELGGGFAAIGTALGVMVGRSLPLIGGLLGGINPLVAALTVAALKSPEMRKALMDLGTAVQPLLASFALLAGALVQALTPAIQAAVPLVSLLATVGGAVAETLAPVVMVVAGLAAAFKSLPGPLQTVVIAILALIVAQGRFSVGAGLAAVESSAAYTKIATAAMTAAGVVKAAAVEMAAAQAGATGGMARLGAAGGVAASGGLTALRGAGAGLLSMFGGPLGLALGVVGGLVTAYVSSMGNAAKNIDRMSESAKTLTTLQRELNVELAKTGGSVSTAALATIAKSFDEVSKAATEVQKNGGGFAGWLNSTFGNETQRTVQDTANRFRDLGTATKDGFADLGVSSEQLAKVVSGTRGEFDAFINGPVRALGSNGAAVADVMNQQRDAFIAARTAAESLSPGVITVADAIKTLSDTASTGAERVQALKTMLDSLSGKQISAAEASARYNDSINNIVDSTAKAADASMGLGKALVNADGSLNTAARNGSSLSKTLLELRNASIDNAQAAYDSAKATGTVADAQAAATKALDRNGPALDALAGKYGLTRGEVDKFAGALGLVPQTIVSSLSLQGASKATNELALVSAEMNAVPGRKDVTVAALTEEARTTLRSLGFSIKDLPTGNVQVIANTAEAAAKLANVTTAMTALDQTKVNPSVGLLTGEFSERNAETVRLMAALDASRADPQAGLIYDDFMAGKQFTLSQLQILAAQIANPEVRANIQGALNNIATAAGALAALDGRSATTTLLNRVITRYEEQGARPANNGPNVAGFANGGAIRRAGGGEIRGPGGETSDDIPMMASNNEHVWSAAEVRGAGGHSMITQMRAMARTGVLLRANGGAVTGGSGASMGGGGVLALSRPPGDGINYERLADALSGVAYTFSLDGRELSARVNRNNRDNERR